MNNRSNRKSVFLCFRPIIVFLCFRPIQVEEERSSDQQGCSDPEQMEDYKSPKSKPRRMKTWLQRGARRRSAQIAKAVFFETKLAKRIQSRKVREDSSQQAELGDLSNPSLLDSSFSKTSSSHIICYLLLVSLVSVILFCRFLAILWTMVILFGRFLAVVMLFGLFLWTTACCANEDNRTVTKTSSTDKVSLVWTGTMFSNFKEMDEGADSDSSSDLFELQNIDLGFPVYETTRIESIKRS